MKKFEILIVVIGMFLLVLPSVMAWEWDNIGTYNEQEKEITIKNAIGFGEDLMKVKLIYNTYSCGDYCYAIFEIDNLKEVDMPDKLSSTFDLDFKGRKGNDVLDTLEKYELKISKGTQNIIDGNGTIVGEEEVWETWDWKSKKLPVGKYKIKIEGYRKERVDVDWLPTFIGVRINEWAWWSVTNFYYRYGFNESSGSTVYDDTGDYNASIAGSYSRVQGLSTNVNDYAVNIYNTSYINTTFTHTDAQIDGDWAVTFWVKSDNSTQDNAYVFSSGYFSGVGGGRGFAINCTEDSLTAFAYSADWAGAEDYRENKVFANVLDGDWHMISMSKNNTAWYYWVDDNYIKKGNDGKYTFDATYNSNSTIFASPNDALRLPFNGTLDKVSWWNTDINTTTVEQLYIEGDVESPRITINYPVNGTTYTTKYAESNSSHVQINYTIEDDGIMDSCYVYNGTANQSVTCGENVSIYLPFGEYDFIVWGEDKAGHENSTLATATYDYKVLERTISYNLSVTEGKTEGFLVNYSTSGTSVSANLNYDGTSYSSTDLNDAFKYSLTIPKLGTATLTNVSVYWEFDVDGDVFDSPVNNQTVFPMTLALCNSTINSHYLNVSFKDEADDSAINASINNGQFIFWIDIPLINRTFTYTNSTDNYAYAFCFNPNETINMYSSIQYSKNGYPLRRWVDTDVFDNNTMSSETLYLLATADGSYVSFFLQTSSGAAISGAEATAEREIGGSYTTIGQDLTDASGGVTFWVNPDYNHRFTFTKSGYDTEIYVIRPTQSSYTLVMTAGTGNSTYTSNLQGIRYVIEPKSGFLMPNTNYDFTFNVTASQSNLDYYSINITDEDDNQFGGSSGSTSTGGNLSVTIFTGTNKTFYGKYYIDVGDGIFLIDPTTYTISNVTAGDNSFYTFFSNLNTLYSKSEGIEERYTMLFFVFFIGFLLLAALTKFTGAELQNPLVGLILVGFFVFIGSATGIFTIKYMPNSYEFFDKWGVAIVVSLFVIANSIDRLFN